MAQMSVALTRSVDAPAEARRLCTAVCHEWALDALVDVCALLVSELVTNAVVHGAGAVELEVAAERGGVRIAVSQRDAVTGLPEARMSGPTEVSGRGLAIVDAMAEQWGAEVDERATRVWFRLATPPAGGPAGHARGPLSVGCGIA